MRSGRGAGRGSPCDSYLAAEWRGAGGGGDFQEVGDITVKVTSEKGDFHSGI